MVRYMINNTREKEYDQKIIQIKTGLVNCYLLKGKNGYILVDTGYARKRKLLIKKLDELGIKKGDLKLLILTHQDFDHTGNAAFIREKYDVKIAMHKEDSEAVERGDMLWNRKGRNIITRIILKILLFVLRMWKFQKFSPGLYLDEGDSLSEYGVEAKIIHIPGHSKGSIGILTEEKELLCGDLFMNTGKKPTKSSLVDIKEQLLESINRIKQLEPKAIYPGHGSSFSITDLKKD